MIVRKKRSETKKKRLLLIGAVLLILTGIAAYFYFRDSPNTATITTSTNEQKPITPATEEEKKESDRLKNATADREAQPQASATQKKSIQPVIVDANLYDQTVEVRAYIPGIVEDGGTCTVTLRKGSHIFTRTSAGFQDAKTTNCTKVTINRSDFPEAGTWSTTVSYDSNTASGTSDVRTFEIK
jgi:uncharacterized protein (UPF0333 family)